MCECKWAYRYKCGYQGDQKRALDPVELELQVLMSHLTQELASEPRYSAKASGNLLLSRLSSLNVFHSGFLSLFFDYYKR